MELKCQESLTLGLRQVLGLEGGADALSGGTNIKSGLANLNELDTVKDAGVGGLARHLELELIQVKVLAGVWVNLGQGLKEHKTTEAF